MGVDTINSKGDSKKGLFGVQKFKNLVSELGNSSGGDGLGLYPQVDPLQVSQLDKKATVPNKRFVKVISKLSDLRYHISSGIGVLSFVLNLWYFIISRGRVVFVLLSVFLEVIYGHIEQIRKLLIRKLFWGRGTSFKFLVQVVVMVLCCTLLTLQGYRLHVTEVVEASSSVGGDLDGMIVYRDLLVQNSSTSTQLPDDRKRIDIVEYIVKSGDTLGSIGSFFDVSVETLQWANDLSAVHIIHPGDTLEIPPGNGVIVDVGEKDTLASLAKKYKGNAQTIAEVNWLDPPFDLSKGQTLFIPDGEIPVQERVVIASSRTSYSGIITQKPNVKYSSHYDPDVGRFLGWPVAGGRGRVTQCYSGWHNAIDIADGSMPDLVAAADGTVTFAGCHSGNCPPPGQLTGGSKGGWGVEIDHHNGYTTVYVHMFSIYVKAGQEVKRGQAIGQMGQSGTATGIHVHFMVWRGGRWNDRNPAAYLSRRVCGQ